MLNSPPRTGTGAVHVRDPRGDRTCPTNTWSAGADWIVGAQHDGCVQTPRKAGADYVTLSPIPQTAMHTGTVIRRSAPEAIAAGARLGYSPSVRSAASRRDHAAAAMQAAPQPRRHGRRHARRRTRRTTIKTLPPRMQRRKHNDLERLESRREHRSFHSAHMFLPSYHQDVQLVAAFLAVSAVFSLSPHPVEPHDGDRYRQREFWCPGRPAGKNFVVLWWQW